MRYTPGLNGMVASAASMAAAPTGGENSLMGHDFEPVRRRSARGEDDPPIVWISLWADLLATL
jgi:hypothetical protein